MEQPKQAFKYVCELAINCQLPPFRGPESAPLQHDGEEEEEKEEEEEEDDEEEDGS